VTRLGELSPIGQFISLEHFLDNCRMSTSFCAAFSTLTRNVLGYTLGVLGVFSQTHLVTLKGCEHKTKFGLKSFSEVAASQISLGICIWSIFIDRAQLIAY
jgi:hypothetical protein